MNHVPEVIAVDLDNTLSYGSFWGSGDPKPRVKNIRLLNKLALNNFIVIHTARRYAWAKKTLIWLDRNNVHYHAIHFEKLPASHYIDDKSATFKQLLGNLNK